MGVATLPWPASAQGVPIVDPKSIIQHGLEIAQMSYLTGARELEADKKARIAELHQEQLEALDATLAMMTGNTPWIGDLEVIPGAEAAVLYDVEDDSPYAARLFGDGKTGIEELQILGERPEIVHVKGRIDDVIRIENRPRNEVSRCDDVECVVVAQPPTKEMAVSPELTSIEVVGVITWDIIKLKKRSK